MGWSVGRQIGGRGAGLGNEVLPWAKALIGAELFGLKATEPSWRTSPYDYGADLRGSILRSAGHLALSYVTPSVRFTAADYLASGSVDYREALGRAVQTRQLNLLRPVLLHTSGMMGGYLGIRSARDSLYNSLLGGREARLAADVVRTLGSDRITLGIHVRRGDFGAAAMPEPGKFNVATPLTWFKRLSRQLAEQVSVDVQLVLASDDPNFAIKESDWGSELPVLRPRTSALGDLAALAACDVVLPSVSSFSLLALFLGESKYAWPRSHLRNADGWLSIWGGETSQLGGVATSASIAAEQAARTLGRGVALGEHDRWPTDFVNTIGATRVEHATSSDLIYYGVIAA